MRVILYSFTKPEENIACEEYFFNKLNHDSNEDEFLRIWECPNWFIVIGNSQRIDESVYLDECIVRGIKVIRRCSAGGAVLQGPGCINFSLYLNLSTNTELKNIRDSYRYILGKLTNVIYQEHNISLEIRGISDLVYMDKKIGGNAQRRNSRVLLHHGTILYDVNYELMETTLKIPIDQPVYRMNRQHRDFVGIIPVAREQIIKSIIKAFTDNPNFSNITDDEVVGIQKLANEKYSKDEWNFRR